MISNLFISGQKRTGKSTLIKTLIEPIIESSGGFFVQRLYIAGQTRAFRLVDITQEDYLPNRHIEKLEGMTNLIAVMNGEKHYYLEPFETVGITALLQASRQKRLVLMDELGRIETGVAGFLRAVNQVLDCETPVLGVLKKEANPFLDSIRKRSDVLVIDTDDCGFDVAKDSIQEFLTAYKLIPAIKG